MNRMRILVIGATSKIGSRVFHDLQGIFGSAAVIGSRSGLSGSVDRHGLEVADITDPVQISSLIGRQKPDVVINFAALADVFRCEKHPEEAERLNVQGAANVATACKREGCRMIQISSDYVFDGAAGPSFETDAPKPINEYGRSKLRGESVCRSVLPKGLTIVRLSHVFYSDGSDLATGMLDFSGETVCAPDDIVTTPTDVSLIAPALARIIKEHVYGIVHCAGKRRISWYELAVELAGPAKRSIRAVPSSNWQNDGVVVRWPRDGGIASVYFDDLSEWVQGQQDARLLVEYVRIHDAARAGLGYVPVVEPLPSKGDSRWGASIIFRLGPVAESLLREIEMLSRLTGDCCIPYNHDNLHSTVLSVGSYLAGSHEIEPLKHVLRRAAKESTAFRNEYRGIIGAPSSVLAKGWPGDGGLRDFRNKLTSVLAAAGIAEYPDKSRMRTTSHASLVLFESPLKTPSSLAKHLDERRDFGFGALLVESVELVTFERTAGSLKMITQDRVLLRR